MRAPLPWHGVAIALALAFAGVACRSAPYVWVNSLPVEPVGDGGGGPVTISAGDMVDVQVFGQDAMSTKGEVRSDGTLAIPLLGQVAAAGRRPEELASSLKERLKPYVVSPEVTVVIQESRVLVSMVGEIKAVGVVELRPPATVLQALAMAGGLTDFADRSGIYVLRTIAGVTTRIRFRYESLIEADPIAIRFRLKTGDVIVVE
jgi:polysaccharide export outer membrane protein